MKATKQTVFLFPSYAPQIYADSVGDFFDKRTNRQLIAKYYNGRICIQQGKKRYGVVKLRKTAVRAVIEVIELPF